MCETKEAAIQTQFQFFPFGKYIRNVVCLMLSDLEYKSPEYEQTCCDLIKECLFWWVLLRNQWHMVKECLFLTDNVDEFMAFEYDASVTTHYDSIPFMVTYYKIARYKKTFLCGRMCL